MGRNRSHPRDASRRLAGGMGAARTRPPPHPESATDDEVSPDTLLQQRALYGPEGGCTLPPPRARSSAVAHQTGDRGRVEISPAPRDVEPGGLGGTLDHVEGKLGHAW